MLDRTQRSGKGTPKLEREQVPAGRTPRDSRCRGTALRGEFRRSLSPHPREGIPVLAALSSWSDPLGIPV